MLRTVCVVACISLITSLFLISCTHYYDPIAYPIRPETVSAFRSTNEISLENVQPSRKELIGSVGAHTWMGDLHITPAVKYPTVVIPAEAGIHKDTGCRIRSGMTGLAI